ncbi:hypothetical protein CsSME_00043831 [Camellia sinensis var. sinensis]
MGKYASYEFKRMKAQSFFLDDTSIADAKLPWRPTGATAKVCGIPHNAEEN